MIKNMVVPVSNSSTNWDMTATVKVAPRWHRNVLQMFIKLKTVK